MNSTDAASAEHPTATARPLYSLWQLTAYFLKLGTLGFGGPVALVGYMHRDLVEQRGWISDADYKEGLALAQLAPGPLAAQLAIYLGYVHYRIVGATLVSLAFVLPSFVIVVALGWAYQRYGGLSWMQAVFYGVGPCVIGIIAHSAYKLTGRTIGRDWLLWPILLFSAACTIATETEYIAVFLAAGAVVWWVRTRPRASAATARGRRAAGGRTLAWFAQRDDPDAVGYRVVLYQGGRVRVWQRTGDRAVFVRRRGARTPLAERAGVLGCRGRRHDHPRPRGDYRGLHWLQGRWADRSHASVRGHLLALLLVHRLAGPLLQEVRRSAGIKAFVDGVTAAAIGAICGSVLVLAQRTLLDAQWQLQGPKLLIFAGALAVMASGRRVPEPVLVLAAALAGLLFFQAI